jgi:hypothetical protein
MLEAQLMERDGWTREDLRAYQRERVRALIAHAVSRLPYYRDVLGAGGAERKLAEPVAPIAEAGEAATGAVPPVVDVQPVAALERQPGDNIRLVRSV